jgi:hypothetical protein
MGTRHETETLAARSLRRAARRALLLAIAAALAGGAAPAADRLVLGRQLAVRNPSRPIRRSGRSRRARSSATAPIL